MTIDLPQLHNFNKDRLAPSNEKLASFTVGQLPKNIMKPFMFISTSKLNITYQKLRDRYEYLRRLEPLTPCDPKCQEGWYWDCDSESCKEYSSYYYAVSSKSFIMTAYLASVPNPPSVDCEIIKIFGSNNQYAFVKMTSNLVHTYQGGVCEVSYYLTADKIISGISELTGQGSGGVGTLVVGAVTPFNTKGKPLLSSGSGGVKIASTDYIINYSSSYVEHNLGELYDDGDFGLGSVYSPLGLWEAFACSENAVFKVDIYGVK